jgi:uncharacterized membrane protein
VQSAGQSEKSGRIPDHWSGFATAMAGDTAVHRKPSFLRTVRARPRLFLSGVLGLCLIAILSATTEWKIATRLLAGWDIGVGLYLVLAYRLMAHSDVHRIRRRAALQDEARIVLLVLTAGAALASLAAIIAELGATHGSSRTAAQLVVATLTIVLSWAFTHTMFALHYAHEFYDENDGQGGGMAFPGTAEPDYWDFAYFSFVIGMTSQVSDVAVTSPAIRRTVFAHGVVSFFFNAALLALTVNIAASAI